MKKIYMFVVLCLYTFAAAAQDMETVINLSDARFTVRASHGLNFVNDEEIIYYVDNHTDRDYKLVVNVSVTYSCGKSANYILGVNKIILVKANSTWNGNRDGDWVHQNLSVPKNCQLSKNGGKTSVQSISVRLGQVIDYTAEKELEAAKGKARDIADEGYAALHKNELDLAESKFNEALKLYPDFKYANDGLAKVKTKRDALSAKKKQVEDLVKEGNDFLGKKELASAESKFNSALAIDKENAEAQAGLQKVKDAKNALADQKTKVDGFVSAGNDLLAKEDLDGAEKEFNKALEIDKENVPAKAGLAKIADKRKNLKDATKKDDKDSTSNAEESASASEEESKVKADGSGGESTYEEPAETPEEYAARMETERLERKNNYYNQKAEQNEILSQNAAAADAAQMEGMLALALIIYQNMGNDKPENIFKGNAPHFNMQLGFNMLSAPIINNSSIEEYDGNNYSYTDLAKNGNVFTLGLEGQAELWPLYGKNFGFGITGGGSAGYNGGSTSFIYNTGIKWFLGHENVQLAGEYTIGRKNLSYTDILNSQEMGTGGTSKYGFRRFGLGPRFVFENVDFIGETTMKLDIMPLFEQVSTVPVYLSNTPMVMRWENGIRANVWFHNRMHIYAELFPQYQRTGDIDYALSKELTRKGTYFQLGVIRHWDFFASDAYASSFEDLESFFGKKNTISLSVANPSIGWFGIRDKENEVFFNSNLSPGLIPIGIDFDLGLHDNLSAYIGGNVNLNTGGTFRTKSDNQTPVQAFNTTLANSTDVRFRMITAEIPVGIRILSNMVNTDRYWLKAGVASHIAIEKNVAVNTDLREPSFNDVESFGDEVKSFYTSYQLGAGTDFMAMYSGFRVGLTYSVTTKPFVEAINAPLKSITLNTAFLF